MFDRAVEEAEAEGLGATWVERDLLFVRTGGGMEEGEGREESAGILVGIRDGPLAQCRQM